MANGRENGYTEPVKTFLAIAIGFQVILGNLCMMNVAFAAGEHHETSAMTKERVSVLHRHCRGSKCTPNMIPENFKNTQVACPDGNCMFMKSPEAVGISTNDNSPRYSPLVSTLITQALLATGTTTESLSQPAITESPHTYTVVLRQ